MNARTIYYLKILAWVGIVCAVALVGYLFYLIVALDIESDTGNPEVEVMGVWKRTGSTNIEVVYLPEIDRTCYIMSSRGIWCEEGRIGIEKEKVDIPALEETTITLKNCPSPENTIILENGGK